MSTIPEATFDPERELRDSFRRAWLLNESWRESDEEVTNYASGHHGSISDVETPSWASLTSEQQKLICHAGQIGQTHQADVELENPRLDLAIGLAAVEIAQTLVGNKQTQKNWPEAVKIAVKWI